MFILIPSSLLPSLPSYLFVILLFCYVLMLGYAPTPSACALFVFLPSFIFVLLYYFCA